MIEKIIEKEESNNNLEKLKRQISKYSRILG